jgi:hypothetical protein
VKRRRTVPALLLAVSTFALLGALCGFQATGATAAPRLLGRLTAALFELDRWTPQHREELRTIAANRTRGPVDVKGLPVAVSVAPADVLSADGSTLARAIAAAAGERLYADGASAFAGPDGGGNFSMTSPERWAIALLDKSSHAFWQAGLAAAAVLALAALGLCALTSASGLAGALRTAASGAAAFAALAAVFWAGAGLGAGIPKAAADRELLRMLRDCAWLGLRNGLALTAAGAALVLMLRTTQQTGAGVQEWSAALDEPAP